jgi:hypothetical protein
VDFDCSKESFSYAIVKYVSCTSCHWRSCVRRHVCCLWFVWCKLPTNKSFHNMASFINRLNSCGNYYLLCSKILHCLHIVLVFMNIFSINLTKKNAVAAYSIQQFVIPMQAVGQSQLNYFGNRRAWDRKILQLYISLQCVNIHCVSETGIGYCVKSAMHVNT